MHDSPDDSSSLMHSHHSTFVLSMAVDELVSPQTRCLLLLFISHLLSSLRFSSLLSGLSFSSGGRQLSGAADGIERIVVVSRGISSGIEIAVGYSGQYWKWLDKPCLCKEACCRFRATSDNGTGK
ncbi:hypothetical protein DTO027I6_9903 [Penicillium roqueforti]|nr:hypothetical protein CBS147337_9989 [Penicillium roqueforti]KAI3184988.1 hypothetical protein DTO027I6_9903 [Penicillium roqueforti]